MAVTDSHALIVARMVERQTYRVDCDCCGSDFCPGESFVMERADLERADVDPLAVLCAECIEAGADSMVRRMRKEAMRHRRYARHLKRVADEIASRGIVLPADPWAPADVD